MRILLATGGPALPQMVGGSQRTADTLLKALQRRGHDVALTAALIGADWLGLRGKIAMRLSRRQAVCDVSLGYPVFRSWFPAETAGEVAERFRPDIVVILAHAAGRMAQAFDDAGVPILFAFQDAEYHDSAAVLDALRPLFAVANSQFTANVYRQRFDAQSIVIHPMINGGQYRTKGPHDRVTFINPAAVKGRDKALEIAAALPGTRFAFQQTWDLSADEERVLSKRLAQLPNVVLEPRVDDMRSVYARTRVLLCPSIWEEGYGRVASEAQFSGIPVVGSDRGGLPEAIGDGGFVIGVDEPVERWVAAISTLCSDEAEYARMSAKALAYANRPELDLNRQVDAWERRIREVAAARG